jgi:hypothetical protein
MDDEGHMFGFDDSVGVPNSIYAVPLSTAQDTFPVSINLKENVIDVENPYSTAKTYSPVTVCRNSWEFEFLKRISADPIDYTYNCITVKYDTESLRGYSVAGFGPNYCAENEDQFLDKVEGTCFWGGIVGGVAVSMLSGPGAPVMGGVILPVTIGSAGTACEKLVNMAGKWPHSQYE